MKKQTLFIIAVLALIAGAGIGYFFGYDIGFEKAVSQTQVARADCEKEAEDKARVALKPKYGDPVSKEFVLGSPHYRDFLEACLSGKGVE